MYVNINDLDFFNLVYGAVSSSGFGDGGYTCYTHADENGVIDFAFIVFI